MQLGVCYYPEHWPEERWAIDARQMVETGLARVRIGEFAWSRIEPEPGRFEWDWLDRAVETLHEAGLGIIMGTPTATPPKWLVDRMPDMVALDRSGRPRGFGSRRHYCFSHEGYRAEAERITRAVAERYGQHPGVVSWQTDNEYGCHDTVQSFSPAARDAFRQWLADRYGAVEALNAAWGNVFWSMEYRSFGEVELPNLTVTEANPAHWLAFRRFSSDQVVRFNKAQVDILRELSPGRDITHNAMGFYTGYDHYDLAADLDVLGWDSYPLGFLEMFRFSEEEKRAYAHQGHPDIAAFHHDLYRGCATGGRWSVLEQQPGPVNWARHNPAPLPGMVRLWTLEAYAHGAEMLCYFRWRQFPQAQEQMHAGLLRPDAVPAPALGEAQEAASDLESLGAAGETVKQAALVFDYAAEWMTQIQPQGEGKSALWAAFRSYSALRKLGLNVDIVSPGASLDGYALVVVPCQPIVSDTLAASLDNFDGQLVIGPRSGSRGMDFAIPDTLAPGKLAELVGGTVTLSESWRPGLLIAGEGWEGTGWFDHLEGEAEPDMTGSDGRVACWKHGKTRYAACWPEGSFIDALIARAAADAGLPSAPLPEGLRQRRVGDRLFTFDYTDASVRWEDAS
ncbi:beta-galactosidase [Qipengyuania flava]|uniref:beta-galactosidase n=1 Tax=Qipengyuania flava TaxID=192812 RepID=UPI001C63A0AD|nr:beta-galactosidase [Qipengyuania flava]QYJ07761.1 beta-galactosidase [Qipengyuania flava]